MANIYTVNSITTTDQRYEISVNFSSGVSGNIDWYYFWYSTEGCDVALGGDSSTTISKDELLGFTEITASFSEQAKGWSTFQSWLQECGNSLNDKYFTFNKGELYQHYKNDTRNNFYNVQYDSSICVLFNDSPSSVKNFNALGYEGSQSRVVQDLTDGEYYNNEAQTGWYADYISTDLETGFVPEFKNKEGKWFNHIRGNQANTLANLNVNQFSTQGIGRPSVVASDDSSPVEKYTLTIKDLGDTD